MCNERLATIPKEYAVLAVLLLATSAAFALGYQAGALNAGQGTLADPVSLSGPGSGISAVVASKSGHVYYLPWCGGASRITESNKVWFIDPAHARSAGYVPASNCDGL